MSNYKTYAKEKWLYFASAITVYFLPFIIVTACLLPFIKAAGGFKIAIGLGIVFINAIPFLMGIFKSFFAHFPMLNILSIAFLFLAVFFTGEVFSAYVDRFLWIESAAAVGSIVSCILWAKYCKYSKWHESVKANVRSGAFVMKDEQEESNND